MNKLLCIVTAAAAILVASSASAASVDFVAGSSGRVDVSYAGNFDLNFQIINTDTNAVVVSAGALADSPGSWDTTYDAHPYADVYIDGVSVDFSSNTATIMGLPPGNYRLITSLGSGSDYSYSSINNSSAWLYEYNYDWRYEVDFSAYIF